MELKEEGGRRGHRRPPRRGRRPSSTSRPNQSPSRRVEGRARWTRQEQRAGVPCQAGGGGAGRGGGEEQSRVEGPTRRRKDRCGGFVARRSRRGPVQWLQRARKRERERRRRSWGRLDPAEGRWALLPVPPGPVEKGRSGDL
ncbi:hypothetical protein PAHAL_6G203500 [Panicum hallii]|uniref:Uncharacterized protein n=1 Tax=Panicum hallii TaxID=206008 RepID=A0A2T8IGY2_9POAL|nr:hypothetical protein PAHAL_6G203500 [Panicum hallii]